MAQSRTAAFIAKTELPDTVPVLLVRAMLSGGTRYWTSRAGSYGGQAYTELLKAGLTLGLGLDPLGRALRSFGRLDLANESDGTGSRTSDLLATDIVAARAVEVDWLYHGLTHPTDTLRLFTGMLEVPDADCFDDQTLRLNLMDDGNPLWAGIQDLACARIHKILGTKITQAAWPGADPDVLGEIEPEIYGAVTETRCLPVDAGGVDVLSADVAIGATTIPLSDATRVAGFDASGTAMLGADEITYTGKSGTSLTGVSGVASAHVAGEECYQIQAEYTYLVAKHACKSVSNIKVDGALKTTGYTVDLTGPTLIKFTTRPKAGIPVTFTAQAEYGATVTDEQDPGMITVTAEQSPGSISTTAEHTNTIASEGSHGHTTAEVRTQYLTSGCPFSHASPGNYTKTWAVAGSGSADYHCTVTSISGTWTFAGRTLTVGDNYWTQGSAPAEETLAGASGFISVSMMERVATVNVASTSGAASGVSAGRTGATASSMAALSGSTAANMSALAGSTAVSVSQVQDAVASGADRVIGTEVVCDAEGYEDDGTGTYTGTPDALIVNPADQLKHILAVQLGLTLADWVDTTSFAAARSAWATAGVRCDWGLYDQIDSAELLERLRWSVAARLFQGAAGKFKLHALPLTGSVQKTIVESTGVLSPASGGSAIRVGRTSLVDLYNQVYVLYGKHIVGSGYAGTKTASDATSQSTYRMTRTLILENDFVRDATAAQWLADTYLAWHKDQKWRATVDSPASPVLHLEPCDKIALTSSRMPGGGWTAEEFWIESASLTLLPEKQESRATLVCREA